MECKKNRKHKYIAVTVVTLSLLSLTGGILCFVISHAIYMSAARDKLSGEPSSIVNILDVCGGTLLAVALLSFMAHAFVRGDR